MKNKGLIQQCVEILGSKEKVCQWESEINTALQKRSNSGTEVEDAIFKPLRNHAINKKVSGLKIGDMVILKPKSALMLYDGAQFEREQYKEIHTKNLKGEIVDLEQLNNHYFWGEYARVKWDNGRIKWGFRKDENTDFIHTSWLVKE